MSVGILRAIWARASDDIYVVGDDALILHYDGDRWATVTIPALGGHDLFSIDGAGDIVAVVGDAGAVAFHDGRVWTAVSPPSAAALKAVTVVSRDEIYAAGATPIYRWSGQSWTTLDDSTDDWLTLWRRGADVYGGSASGAFVNVQGASLARYSWPSGRPGTPASVAILRGAALPGNEHLVISRGPQQHVERTNGATHTTELFNDYVALSTSGAIRFAAKSNGDLHRYEAEWTSIATGRAGVIALTSVDGCSAFALLPNDVLKY